MLTRADYRWSCGGYHHRAHKPPVQRPKKQRKAEKPTPIVDKGLMYEVSKVLDIRKGVWGSEYLVSWRGYAASEDSWISELPKFFRKPSYPHYKSDSECSDGETETDSDSDDDSDSSDDEEEDEEEDEDEEMMHKRARTAKAKVAHERVALTKQCDAVSALLALSKAVTKLYENDTESDSDTD
jgi:hypothetical protein